MKRKRDSTSKPQNIPKRARKTLSNGTPIESTVPEAEYQTPTEVTIDKSSNVDTKRISGVKGVIPFSLANGQITPAKRKKSSVPQTLFKSTTNGDTSLHAATPFLVRNANRSARKTSTRRIVERTVAGASSDDEAEFEESELGNIILEDEREEQEEDREEEEEEEEVQQQGECIGDAEQRSGEDGAEPTKPVMLVKRERGRPKGSRNKVSSVPVPENLEPHELYFYQTRLGTMKTSDNTFPSQLLLSHEEYFKALGEHDDRHMPQRHFLHKLHSCSFDQWKFELRGGFNICLYGYGSKRALAMDFAEHLHSTSDNQPTIVVVNGYSSTLTLRDILMTITNAILPNEKNLPSQPQQIITFINSHISKQKSPKENVQPMTLIIHSLDALPLRRPHLQFLLSTLAAHPLVDLLATVDTPTFPLLWDISTTSKFRFVYHDCTTFTPFGPEIDSVDSVNELLGRRSRRIGGRDGVAFVLRSLPENARALFQILIREQLDVGLDGNYDEEQEEDRQGRIQAGGEDEKRFGYVDNILQNRMTDPFANPKKERPGQKNNRGRRSSNIRRERGIEQRVLYHKAVENFVCSSEMAFRTLLKEFHDHAIVETRRDGAGVERLWIPFRKDELELLVEEMDGTG